MSTWALVPIKPRSECKSRLATILPAPDRLALVRHLLRNVLLTLRRAPGIDHVALVSAERDEVATDVPLLLCKGRDLNSDLACAALQARMHGATTILILPADLPWVGVDDVCKLLSGAGHKQIALAPDRHERGTNALCFRTSTQMTFHFGDNSFQRHLTQAFGLVDSPLCVRTAGLGFDLDTAADFARLREQEILV